MFFGNCAVGDRWLGLREKLASLADQGQTDPLWTGLVWLLLPSVQYSRDAAGDISVLHTHIGL